MVVPPLECVSNSRVAHHNSNVKRYQEWETIIRHKGRYDRQLMVATGEDEFVIDGPTRDNSRQPGIAKIQMPFWTMLSVTGAGGRNRTDIPTRTGILSAVRLPVSPRPLPRSCIARSSDR